MNSSDLNIFNFEEKTDCKGLVFRGYKSFFNIKSERFEIKQGIRLLKKRSCLGCEHCGGLITEFEVEDFIMPDIVHGALYTLNFLYHRDPESGIVDDFDIEVVRIKEENKNGTR